MCGLIGRRLQSRAVGRAGRNKLGPELRLKRIDRDLDIGGLRDARPVKDRATIAQFPLLRHEVTFWSSGLGATPRAPDRPAQGAGPSGP